MSDNNRLGQRDERRNGEDPREDPSISVIMTNFNKAQYLAQAISSVLCQTFEKFELVIVDDASTDGSWGIAEEFAKRDSRIRLIRHPKNQGDAAARNTGVYAAKSSLVTFLDSDDLYAQVRLETEVAAVEKRSAPAVAYSDAILLDNSEQRPPEPIITPSKPSGMIIAAMLAGIPGFHGALVTLPRICFDKVGYFDESLSWGQDLELCLRLARHFPFVFVATATYGYRIHSGNTVGRVPRRKRYEIQSSILERHVMQVRSNFGRKEEFAAYTNLFSCYVGARRWGKLFRYGLTSTSGFRCLTNLPFAAVGRNREA